MLQRWFIARIFISGKDIYDGKNFALSFATYCCIADTTAFCKLSSTFVLSTVYFEYTCLSVTLWKLYNCFKWKWIFSWAHAYIKPVLCWSEGKIFKLRQCTEKSHRSNLKKKPKFIMKKDQLSRVQAFKTSMWIMVSAKGNKLILMRIHKSPKMVLRMWRWKQMNQQVVKRRLMR